MAHISRLQDPLINRRIKVGTFGVSIEVRNPATAASATLDALVDTGSSYTWAPRSVLERLGVSPSFRMEFETADGRIIEREAAETQVRLDGRTRTRIVIFGDENTTPLLGADTLEGFGLAPDPINHRLIPVRGLLMTL